MKNLTAHNLEHPNVKAMYKKKGETPLEAIERFRDEQIIVGNSSFEQAKLTYLGRLDPMAEGVLLVGINVNEEERKMYLNVEKEYVVDILCGIESDTWDALGLVTGDETKNIVSLNKNGLKEVLETFVGTHSFPYPLYSSKPVDGTPLFSIARMGGSIDTLPTRDMTFTSIELLSLVERDFADIQKETIADISKVKGDFRQEKITQAWLQLPFEHDKKLTIARIKVACKSGAYMRTLAHEISHAVGLSAIAYGIIRTKVGKFEII